MESNLNVLTEKAGQGDVQAMFELGSCYYHGTNGVQEHYVKAMGWFEKVAEDGTDKELTVQSCNILVSYYLKGDVVVAEKWAKRASKYNSIEGLKQVALHLCNGKDFEEESAMKEKGVMYLIELAQKGDKEAIKYLPENVFNYKQSLGENDCSPAIKQFMDNEYKRLAEQYNVRPYKSTKRSLIHIACRISAILFGGFFFVYIIFNIFPTVVIVENGKKYREETVFNFHKEFEDGNNKIHKLEGLQLFSTYVYNASDNSLAGYKVVYKPKDLDLIANIWKRLFSESRHSSKHRYYIDRTSVKHTPEYIIAPNKMIKVEDSPRIYFKKAPQFIEEHSHIVDSSIEVWVLLTHR